jgi:hypothetical protein
MQTRVLYHGRWILGRLRTRQSLLLQRLENRGVNVRARGGNLFVFSRRIYTIGEQDDECIPFEINIGRGAGEPGMQDGGRRC